MRDERGREGRGFRMRGEPPSRAGHGWGTAPPGPRDPLDPQAGSGVGYY